MVRLSDAAIVLTGVSPEAARDGGCRFVRIRNLSGVDEELLTARQPTAGRAVPIELGDVLLAARGERTLALRALDAQVGAYATLDIYLIRPDPTRLDSNYLAAFLMRPETGANLRRSTAGSSLPRIPKDAIADLSIPLPPIERQRAIGGLAASLRRGHDLAGRLVAAETRLAETTLERAFARFA